MTSRPCARSIDLAKLPEARWGSNAAQRLTLTRTAGRRRWCQPAGARSEPASFGARPAVEQPPARRADSMRTRSPTAAALDGGRVCRRPPCSTGPTVRSHTFSSGATSRCRSTCASAGGGRRSASRLRTFGGRTGNRSTTRDRSTYDPARRARWSSRPRSSLFSRTIGSAFSAPPIAIIAIRGSTLASRRGARRQDTGRRGRQQVAAPDLADLLLGVAAAHELERHVERLARRRSSRRRRRRRRSRTRCRRDRCRSSSRGSRCDRRSP